MISIENSPEHVLAMRLSGTAEKAEIMKVAQIFAAKFARHDRINLVVDVSEWSDITGDAMIEDAKFELGQIDKVSRIPRVAMVSDKQFVRALVNLIRPLMPNVEFRNFGAAEYEQALAFASEMRELKTSDAAAITILDSDTPKIIAYEIDGTITTRDVETVMPKLNAAFEREDKVDLLARMKNFGGFHPAILTESSLFSTKLSAISHVRRYAVVGAPGWMKSVAGVMGSMLPITMRFFSLEEEAEAWNWLKS